MRLSTTGKPLLLIAAVLFAMVVANTLAVQLRSGYLLNIGTRPDRGLITGFHGPEQDSAGTSYRWTSDAVEVVLSGPATHGPALLTLSLGWLPPGAVTPRALSLFLDGAYSMSLALPDQPRDYTIMLPPGLLGDGELRLGLRSETTVVPPDERPLGVRLDAVTLSLAKTAFPFPAPLPLLAQAGIGIVWLVSARRLRLGPLVTAGVAALIVTGLVLMPVFTPPLAALWQTRLFIASLLCAGLVFGAGVLLPRIDPEASPAFIRAVLLITLAALALRLIGILHPSFFAHDLLVNSKRLDNVQLGNLTLFDRPSEFFRNVSIVSPTVYMLMAPFTLIAGETNALQGFYTVLDGLSPLLVALLARRLGLSERASLIAAAIMAWLPMQLTALYWGFVKQIIGQALTLLTLVVIAGPAPRRMSGWLAIVLLLAVVFLTHNGVLLLIGTALGIFVLLGVIEALRSRSNSSGPLLPWILHSEQMAFWRGWIGAILAAALISLAIQYFEAIILMIGGMITGATATDYIGNQINDPDARMAQIWIGLNTSFEPLPLLLIAAGLIALIWRSSGHRRLLVIATTISALVFLAVDIATAMQARYGYFIAPIASVGIGALIEPILASRLGRGTAWALVALVLVAGLGLWIAAILYGVKPSVNPLTH